MGTKKSKFRVDIMSNTDEVTGSCTLVNVHFPDDTTYRFFVDCGLYQEKQNEDKNKSWFFKPYEVDFGIITHNHIDHTGKLPFLAKKGFRGNIYMTHETRTLLPLALYDAHKIMSRAAKKENENSGFYKVSDLERVLGQIHTVQYRKDLWIDERIRVTFFENGHLIGAAIVRVEIFAEDEHPINLLFTGDYHSKNMFFEVPPLPEEIYDMPLNIICESTYGNLNSNEMVKSYENSILEWLKKDDGIVLSPVFSLGRCQEILFFLKQLQDFGQLCESIPIYLDGKLSRKYTELFETKHFSFMPDFLPKNFHYVTSEIRGEILYDEEKKIVLSSSGMGTHGAAQMYIQNWITEPNVLIHFTGYAVEDSLAKKLQNAVYEETVQVGGFFQKKKATIKTTSEFSAHAKADELLVFLNQFRDLDLVLINHGAIEVKSIFAKSVVNEVDCRAVGILDSHSYYRLSPEGFIKSLPTKFGG